MEESLQTVKFYYDYKSPFTYLALEPACELERRYRVKLRFIPFEIDIPASFGGRVSDRTERDWRKVRYLYLDARRWANERGLTVRGPQKIFDSRLSLMGGLYADRHGKFRPYSDRVFERFFKRELDIEDRDALAAVVAEAGLDPDDFIRYSGGDGPGELAEAAREADGDGIFGVPTFVVESEPFWGNDRVEWVAKKLNAMGLSRTVAKSPQGRN